MPQDGVATTMATPEMLPVWRHMDYVLIANLAGRVEILTRMLSKGCGDEILGPKPKKSKDAEVTNIIHRVWQGVSKIDKKGLCSLYRPNGSFKVTHGC